MQKKSLHFLVLLVVGLSLLHAGSAGQAAAGDVQIYLPVMLEHAYGPVTRTFEVMGDSTDAELGNLYCAAWAGCRTASYANFWLDGSPNATVESSYSAGGKYAIKRIALFFDTSALPDQALVAEVKLRFYSGAVQGGLTKLHVVRTTATTPPGPSSFGAFSFVSGGSAVVGSSEWVEIPLGETALSWIHTAGFTRLGLVHDLDLTGLAPSGLNFVSLALWEYPAKEPELIVTYIAP